MLLLVLLVTLCALPVTFMLTVCCCSVWNRGLRERNVRLQEGAGLCLLQGEAGGAQRTRNHAHHKGVSLTSKYLPIHLLLSVVRFGSVVCSAQYFTGYRLQFG